MAREIIAAILLRAALIPAAVTIASICLGSTLSPDKLARIAWAAIILILLSIATKIGVQ